MPVGELRSIPQEMQHPAHRQPLTRRLHIGLVVRERRRCRARRTLRQREAELERCHAIVDVVDDSAAEHLAEPCQMIGRLIMIAVRCVPRARPGPARQHMPAMSMRSEAHTSELQSLMRIPYAVFCLNTT